MRRLGLPDATVSRGLRGTRKGAPGACCACGDRPTPPADADADIDIDIDIDIDASPMSEFEFEFEWAALSLVMSPSAIRSNGAAAAAGAAQPSSAPPPLSSTAPGTGGRGDTSISRWRGQFGDFAGRAFGATGSFGTQGTVVPLFVDAAEAGQTWQERGAERYSSMIYPAGPQG